MRSNERRSENSEKVSSISRSQRDSSSESKTGFGNLGSLRLNKLVTQSSVGIATGYTAFRSWQGQEVFFTPQRLDRLWDPASPLSNVNRSLSPLGKAAGTWSWPLTSIKYRSQVLWSYISTPPQALMSWCLVKHRSNAKWFLSKTPWRCLKILSPLTSSLNGYWLMFGMTEGKSRNNSGCLVFRSWLCSIACGSDRDRHFGGKYRLHHHSRRVTKARNHRERSGKQTNAV
jgi:hypothetical protein